MYTIFLASLRLHNKLLNRFWFNFVFLNTQSYYPQLHASKNNCIFLVTAYLFTHMVCLSRAYQTGRFYCTSEAILCKVHFYCFICYFEKYLTGCQNFINKTGTKAVCMLDLVNKSIPDWHFPKWKQNGPLLCNDIACNCMPIGGMALWYACIQF